MERRPLTGIFRLNEWWFVSLFIAAGFCSLFWSWIPLAILLGLTIVYFIYLGRGIRCPRCCRYLRPHTEETGSWAEWIYSCSHCDVDWDARMGGPQSDNPA